MWYKACGCSLSAADASSKSITISPINMPALSRVVDADTWTNHSHDTYVSSLVEVPQYNINLHPKAKGMGICKEFDFSMDLDEAARQLREVLVLSPFSLKDTKKPRGDGWTNFLRVSIGISLGLSAIGIDAYCIPKKKCRKFPTCKTDLDVEDGSHGTDSQEFEVWS